MTRLLKAFQSLRNRTYESSSKGLRIYNKEIVNDPEVEEKEGKKDLYQAYEVESNENLQKKLDNLRTAIIHATLINIATKLGLRDRKEEKYVKFYNHLKLLQKIHDNTVFMRMLPYPPGSDRKELKRTHLSPERDQIFIKSYLERFQRELIYGASKRNEREADEIIKRYIVDFKPPQDRLTKKDIITLQKIIKQLISKAKNTVDLQHPVWHIKVLQKIINHSFRKFDESGPILKRLKHT